MDPFTLIAGATALYNTIKSAVDAGQDVMDTADKVGALFARVAQVVQLTSTPRKKKLFQSQSDFEAEAVKLYAAKAKAQQMAAEVKNMFVSTYGAAAWDYDWQYHRFFDIMYGYLRRRFNDYGEIIC